jgi:hypothetical protein
MTTQEVKRKLTAILSADVKGYSRLTSFFHFLARPMINKFSNLIIHPLSYLTLTTIWSLSYYQNLSRISPRTSSINLPSCS